MRRTQKLFYHLSRCRCYRLGRFSYDSMLALIFPNQLDDHGVIEKALGFLQVCERS